MKTVLALGLLMTAIATPPVAVADENSYVQRIEPRMAQLTRDQILTEGYRVCQLTHSGHGSSDAIPMVTKDLAVSVPAAVDIIAAAVVELGC